MAHLVTNTRRIMVGYHTGPGGQQHEMLLRVGDGVAWDSVQAMLVALFQAIQSGRFLYQWRVLYAREAERGSTISMPLTITNTALAAFIGQSGYSRTPMSESQYINWVGRSPATGCLTRIGYFGYGVQFSGALRVTPSDGSWVSDVLAILRQSPLIGIDGAVPTWYSYANQGFSAYWQRKVRG